MQLTFDSEAVGTLEPEALVAPRKGERRSFRGLLKGFPPHDIENDRAAEQAWELAHEERKYVLTGK